MACPSCGAPISAPAEAYVEDDSATRPGIFFPVPGVDETTRPSVPISSAAQAAQDTDSASPAAAGDVTADYPLAPKPERTQTVPPAAMPTTEPQTQPALPLETPAPPAAWPSADGTAKGAVASDQPPIEKPSPRPRSPLATISIALLILLLLLVGAAGVLFANGRLPFFGGTPTPVATATVTPAPTATPTIVLKTFTDSGQVFTVGYPSGWLVNIENNQAAQVRLVLFTNSKTSANVNVGTYASTSVTAQQVVETVLAGLSQKTGIANRSAPTSVVIAGQTWTQESGDVTVPQNGKLTAMHAVALATIHGGNTVYFLELAPVDTFPSLEPTFQQIENSFEFLS